VHPLFGWIPTLPVPFPGSPPPVEISMPHPPSIDIFPSPPVFPPRFRTPPFLPAASPPPTELSAISRVNLAHPGRSGHLRCAAT